MARARIAALLLGLMTVASCARAAASGSGKIDQTPPIPPGFHLWPDWTSPLGPSSVRVADLSGAESVVHFTPVAPPDAWGVPAFIDAASPDNSGEQDSVSWLYQDQKGNPLYLLIESSPPSIDQKGLEAAAVCGADELGCQQQNFALVTLDDGTNALLVNGVIARLLNWLVGNVEYRLAGPLASFDEATAIEMASDV